MLKKAWTTKSGEIELRFYSSSRKAFNEMLEKIKNIPGREWDSSTKTWTIPYTRENIKKLRKLEYSFSKKLKKKIDESKKQRAKSKYKDPLLRDYQIKHANKLVNALAEHGGALDGSDTGTGKTYVALSIAKHLKLQPFVITPKPVIPNWKEVAEYFNIKCIVANYEQYREGKIKQLNKIVETEENEKTKEVFEYISYEWRLPEKSLIIFDEVHRCKDSKTYNATMLITAAEQNIKTLCLSATVGDNPTHFYAVGRALRMFKDMGQFMSWMYRRGIKKNPFGAYYFSKKAQKKYLKKIHDDIYTSRGSRIAIKDLGDRFPKNVIIPEVYEMGEKTAKEIDRLYRQMNEELKRLKKRMRYDSDLKITSVLRQRQQIELLKVPTFIELAEDHIAEGMSVAIFVNFTETLEALSKRLKTRCIIGGSVDDEVEREKNRKAFQDDKERIIICNIQAGGEGISLHDIRGEFPRVGLISPTYSAQRLIQVLGRLPRDGAKSSVLQKLVYCAGTVEEDVARQVKDKVKNIKLINDGDLL